MMQGIIRDLSIIEGDDIDSLSLDEEEEVEEDDDDNDMSSNNKKKTKKKNKSKNRNKNKNNKRRFSDQQVRSLESIFESETKLDPRKKIEVAKELGLQPRQVAIWFQNKRARWKSKQIEKNYRVLKSNYDNLKVKLESLRKDKESLLIQLQELRNEVNKRPYEGRCEDYCMTNNNQDNKEKHNNNNTTLLATKSSNLQEEIMDHQQGVVYSDDDKSGNNNMAAFLGQGDEESRLLDDIRENIDGSIVSPAKWCNFDATSLFDQSSSSTHWWDSWT